jgi:membrane-associated phospholipid phosphatase
VSAPGSRRIGRAVAVAVAGLLAGTAGAGPAAAADALTFPGDPDPASVYRIWPWIDGAVVAGSIAVTAGFYGFGSHLIDPSCPCDRQSVNAFDRPAVGNHSDLAYDAATATVGLAIFVPVALDIWDLRRLQPVVEDAVVLAESLSLSIALFSITKFTVQRPFPRTYAGDPTLVNDAAGYHSFYSGHTAVAFTALSVTSMTLARRYHQNVWPWIVTVVVGSGVAAGVVLGGWHFPTDTVVGALTGTAIGIAVPTIHLRTAPVRPTVGLTPDSSGPMLSLIGLWR